MRKGINSILICCCALTAFGREVYERDFQKTVALAGSRSLRVENSNGRVTVRTHASAEASIRASIRCSAPTVAEARGLADRIQIVVEESGSGASVRTEYPKNWRGNVSYSVDYDVIVPETAPLEIRNRFGAVSVDNLHAGATIINNNGQVNLRGSRGSQRIENSFGDVEVRSNDGDVTIRNSNGSVTVSDIRGAIDLANRFGDIRTTNVGRGLTIHSNNGNIEATNVTGVVVITNSFGRVVVADAKSDVKVQNQNGEVQANRITGLAELATSFAPIQVSHIGKALTVRASNATITGDTVGESATVETSFGGVDLRGVKGSVQVTAGNSSIRLVGIGGGVYAKTSFKGVTISDTAGSITVESANGSVTVEPKATQRCEPISLRTSFGPIRVTAPAGVGYNVVAKTSFGRVHSEPEMTISGEISNETLNSKIGGGGCELRLMDQNGDIEILKGRQ
jgi:hypothetical protein